MVPASDDVDVPAEVANVAERYERVERPISGAVSLFVGAVAVGAFLTLSLLQALLTVAATVAVIRVPVFRSGGTARLVTDAGPEAVHADFAGPTPPLLAFQWGIADAVRRTDDGAAYELSYLFGTRSVTMETEIRSEPAAASETGADEVTLVVTAADQPWATYAVSIREGDGETTVDVEWDSDRRFGFRRLPQTFVANRYRVQALEVQGYEVVERDAGLAL